MIDVAPGVIVWISVSRGISQAQVLEVESVRQQLVRLQAASGAVVIRTIAELHPDERSALVARLHEEEHWARYYADLSDRCARQADRLRRRLTQAASEQQLNSKAG